MVLAGQPVLIHPFSWKVAAAAGEKMYVTSEGHSEENDGF